MNQQAAVSNEVKNYQLGQRLAVIGLVVSAGLAFIKLTGGIFTGSTSLSADGLESASDVLASAIIWGGMAIARRPADDRFPYGYGRAESLAGKTVGTILLMSAVLLATHSSHRLMQPAISLPMWILWPLGASFILKGVLAVAKFRTGKRIRSSALIADSGNDAVDMVSAVVAAGAITLNLIDHERFAYADPVGGLGVSIIIFIMGLGIFRRTSQELMDIMPEPGLVNDVRKVASSIEGVLAVEKCFGRKSGTLFFFDLHIEVDPAMTVHDAHEVAHQVKDTILADCPFVKDVLVHVEPFTTQANGST
jgi:cation diffusion facilitator family transporter